MIEDLDELIDRLQAVKQQYPNCEGTIKVEAGELSGKCLAVRDIGVCEDDNEMAREHGRVTGKPQVIVYIDLEEA